MKGNVRVEWRSGGRKTGENLCFSDFNRRCFGGNKVRWRAGEREGDKRIVAGTDVEEEEVEGAGSPS